MILPQREVQPRRFVLVDVSDVYEDSALRFAAVERARSAAAAAVSDPAPARRPVSAFWLWDWLELARLEAFDGLWPAMRAALLEHAPLASDGGSLASAVAHLGPSQLATWGDLALGAIDSAAAYV